jgi:hypothetical protein
MIFIRAVAATLLASLTMLAVSVSPVALAAHAWYGMT